MKKRKSWGVIVLVIVFLWGAGKLGWIEIRSGIDFAIEKDWVSHMQEAEDITGELYITPYDSWDAFEAYVPQTSGMLWLQTYDFTEKKVKKVFRDLLDKGVDVKLIMENHKYKQYTDTFTQVGDDFAEYKNFQIKSDAQMKTEYVHSKITLLDDLFWIQTANLTHSSLFNNREHFFVSYHTGVLQSLKNIFEKDWEGEAIGMGDIHPNLVVCNINCRSVIEHLLSSAQKSIVIQTQYISDQGVLDILKKKASAETFDIKLLLADTYENKKVLSYFGKQRAKILKKPYNHTKMILVDDTTLLLGSMNLSSNSLDNNREIGAIIKDRIVIDKFLKYFYMDWRSS